MTRGNPKLPYVYKHLVVVHGIGDQAPNETSLNFMNNFLRALPRKGYGLDVDNLIGSVTPPAPNAIPNRFDPSFAVFQSARANYVIGFSEVYWQDITNGYLEKFNKQPPVPIFVWAHSINTRLLGGGRTFYTARDAIDNLEQILNLLKKLAVIFKKPELLATILDRFLGDVQMYAESDVIGGQINRRFAQVLARVPAAAAEIGKELGQSFGEPEIYVVAHSEGTVVSYSSLVEAAVGNAAWFPMVRALVTLGSPLDKHYTIWDDRFRTDRYNGPPAVSKIRWFNYWDVSDPVGYGLKQLQPQDPSSDAAKLFTVCFDRGFARYPIPGLAHVAYWEDRAIHEHIIDKVMGLGTTRRDTTVKSRWFQGIQWMCDWLLYVLGRGVCLAAIFYFLVKLAGPVKLSQPVWPFGMQRDWQDALWLAAPPVVCKLLWEWYTHAAGISAVFATWLRSLVWIGWLYLFGVAALKYADGNWWDIKDALGYSTGLVTAVLAWQLHTRVHRGIVQMWRYTKGAGTGAPEAP